jgi:hypothetical protein
MLVPRHIGQGEGGGRMGTSVSSHDAVNRTNATSDRRIRVRRDARLYSSAHHLLEFRIAKLGDADDHDRPFDQASTYAVVSFAVARRSR